MEYSPNYQMPGETTKLNIHQTTKCQEKQQNGILTKLPNAGETTEWTTHQPTKCQEKHEEVEERTPHLAYRN